MYTINRSIAVITPKQPFVDWANQLPDAEWESSLDDFKTDCFSLLIPEYQTDEEAKGEPHPRKRLVKIEFSDEAREDQREVIVSDGFEAMESIINVKLVELTT